MEKESLGDIVMRINIDILCTDMLMLFTWQGVRPEWRIAALQIFEIPALGQIPQDINVVSLRDPHPLCGVCTSA